MKFDEATLFAFLLVFIRCSAMLFSSPMFGAQNTPLQVRIFTTCAISAALTMVVKPIIGPLPNNLGAMFMAAGNEAVAGLLIGVFMSLVLQLAQMAGAILDMQVGLSMSQVMNPVTGVSVTVLSQFKFMLGTVLYLCMNGHHVMIKAFVNSYTLTPNITLASNADLVHSVVKMLSLVSIVAIQIAAPVMAVSLVVDASLGLVNKAVPQMQAMIVGIPAKVLVGLIALSLGLPALATGISNGVDGAFSILGKFFIAR